MPILVFLVCPLLLLACRKQADEVSEAADLPVALVPMIPARTIESSFEMTVSIKDDGNWKEVGQTPGVVQVPACEDRRFFLSRLGTGPDGSKSKLYADELKRLGITRVVFSGHVIPSALNAYRENGLLDGLIAITIGRSDLAPGNIDAFAGLETLESLDLSNLHGLHDISAVATMHNLRSLDLKWCTNIVDFTPIAGPHRLEHLSLSCQVTDEDLRHLHENGALSHLTSLSFLWCQGSHDWSLLAKLTTLRSLDLTATWVKNLSFLSGLPNLTTLHVLKCRNLRDISGLAESRQLTTLSLGGTRQLKEFAVLSQLTNLRSLVIRDCPYFTDLSCLRTLQTLTSLDLEQLDSLEDVTSLAGLKNLKSLNLSYCKSLTAESVQLLQGQLPDCKIECEK